MANKPETNHETFAAAALMFYSESRPALLSGTAEHKVLRFFALGAETKWRYKHLLDKEPETIQWLNRIEKNEILWDIGANVGIYTVYAAVIRGARVLAFEPLAANYYILNANIELNGIDETTHAYCIAFSNSSLLGELNATSSTPGAAGCSFDSLVNDVGESFVPQFQQGMLGYTVDEFISRYQPEFPNHLKIDVDGIEDRIIEGASATLRNPMLKSLSIELDSARIDYVSEIRRQIESAGLSFEGNFRSPNIAPKSTINNFQFRRS